MSNVTLYHNPMCGTSTKALDLIREAGIEPRIVDYMQTGWTAEQVRGLAGRAGVAVSEFLRAKEPLAEELGLIGLGVSEEALLKAMVEHPILVNRPIVETPQGVVLARPQERVKEVL